MLEKIFAAVSNRHNGPETINQRNPLNFLILGGILLIAAIAVGTSVTIVSFRQRALSSGERELQNTVLLLARHFDREFGNYDAIQRDFVRRVQGAGIRTHDAFGRQMSGEDAHIALKTFVSGSPETARLNVFDANGQLINSSAVWPVPAINIADRDYFRQLKTGPQSPDVVITPIRSRFAEGWTTLMVRRITGADGTFLGVVSRSMSPDNFEAFFESLSLGEGSAISMLHRDGTMLARYPRNETMIGQNLNTAPIQQLLRGSDFGTTRLFSPVDGEYRLASARALTGFPVSIIATMKVSTALADWREQTRFLVAVAALSALVIALTLFLIVRRLSAQHHNSKRQLALEKERLDTAINNMAQGLLLYDRDGRIVLLNQRYLEIFHLSPEIVKPGMHFRELIAYRKSVGSFRGDADAYCRNVQRQVDLNKVSRNVVETVDGRLIETMVQPLTNGGWVVTQEDVTERRSAERQIAHLAHYDALTDLPNRVLFRERLDLELERIKHGEQLAMLYIVKSLAIMTP